MSIWADQQILALQNRVKELEERLSVLEKPVRWAPESVELGGTHKIDKRSKEYRQSIGR